MGSEGHGRPRLTAKGERTRARIVEAAARLIYERGVARTTLDDVKAAAGVSGSQMYHYFPDKDELVQAVIGYQAEVIAGNHRQADLGSAGGLQAWRDMVIAQARSREGKGGCPLGSLAGQLAETDPHVRTLLAGGFGQWQAATAKACAACARPGCSRTAQTRTPSPSPFSPPSRAAFSSPRSSGIPAPWKRRSTPSSNLPEAAARMFPQAAESPAP